MRAVILKDSPTSPRKINRLFDVLAPTTEPCSLTELILHRSQPNPKHTECDSSSILKLRFPFVHEYV